MRRPLAGLPSRTAASARESENELFEGTLRAHDTRPLEFDIGSMNRAQADDESAAWVATRLLLELPHSHVPVGSDKLVAWLTARGIRPMIAHPERNKDIMRDLDKLQPFVEAGCLVQLTADAVVGEFGPDCQARALEVLERGWATIMASDAHDTEARPPRLKAGVARAAQLIGDEAASDLVVTMPRRIVEGA